jgi:hypothetical protein
VLPVFLLREKYLSERNNRVVFGNRFGCLIVPESVNYQENRGFLYPGFLPTLYQQTRADRFVRNLQQITAKPYK